jgi:hypothetical protein
MNTDPDKWELVEVAYDYMGMNCIKIEDPERWKDVPEANRIFAIGTVIPWKGSQTGKIVRIELEGEKENLEYVLNLIKKGKS